MTSNVIRAIKYWFKATLRPRDVIEEFQSEPQKVVVSFWIALLFAMLYSLTALLFVVFHRLPAFPPWIPIAETTYYKYQVFWTIPWALGTLIMMSGVSHLLSIAGKKEPSKYRFEDALAVCTIGWVVPSFYFMWIPETFIYGPFNLWLPSWVELLRLAVFPTVWQTWLVAMGLRMTHEVGWPKGIGIGLLTVFTGFVMFLPFMR